MDFGRQALADAAEEPHELYPSYFESLSQHRSCAGDAQPVLSDSFFLPEWFTDEEVAMLHETSDEVIASFSRNGFTWIQVQDRFGVELTDFVIGRAHKIGRLRCIATNGADMLLVPNLASRSNIDDETWAVISSLAGLIREVWGSELTELHLSGSVACANYARGISDVDILVTVSTRSTDSAFALLAGGQELRSTWNTHFSYVDIGYMAAGGAMSEKERFVLEADAIRIFPGTAAVSGMKISRTALVSFLRVADVGPALGAYTNVLAQLSPDGARMLCRKLSTVALRHISSALVEMSGECVREPRKVIVHLREVGPPELVANTAF